MQNTDIKEGGHLRQVFYSLSLLILLCASQLKADNGGLQISISGDLVGEIGLSEDSGAENRLEVREAELIFYAPVNHLFDAMLSGAAHYEEGSSFFETHEAYIGSSKLIPRSRFKLGQFFLGFGRLNRIHRHDWPFISSPKVHEEFFDEEGVIDSGGEYSVLFPTQIYLDLTVGLTSGYTFGHTHNEGRKPAVPTHYARLATFFEFTDQWGTETGLNFVRRKDGNGVEFNIFGLDLTSKIRHGKTLKFLLQSEVWFRHLISASGTVTESLGAYLYPQYGFNEWLQLGSRFDFFTNLNQQDATGASEGNLSFAWEPTITLRSGEFATFRAAYQYKSEILNGEIESAESAFLFQAVFIIGSHPAHEF